MNTSMNLAVLEDPVEITMSLMKKDGVRQIFRTMRESVTYSFEYASFSLIKSHSRITAFALDNMSPLFP